MSKVSNKVDFQGLLESAELPRLVAINSSAELEQSGFGWRTGQLEYTDRSVGIHASGVVLFSTPQVDNDDPEESTYVAVVKLYGGVDLPYRVVGICSFEDVYDQSTETTLQDFRTLGEAADFALAAHELGTFDTARVQDHLQGLEPASKGKDDVVKTVQRDSKREDDGFSR